MKISYSDWWDDIVATLRSNASIFIAIAGAFVFLPSLVAGLFSTPIEPLAQGASSAEALQRLLDNYADNWVSQVALLLLGTLGQLVLFIVLLDPRRPRVGEAFRSALPLFVPFLGVGILVALMFGVAAALFVVPALYLVGRIQLSGAALVAERVGPIEAVRRSFALTKGQGWRIFFFVFLVFLVASVVQRAVDGTVGALVGLFAGAVPRLSPAGLLLPAIDALFASVFFVLGATMWVTLYRRLVRSTT